MALNVRLSRILPSMGPSVINDSVYYQNGISLSGTGQQTKTIPASGTILGTTAGRIRVKIYNGGGTSPTLTDLVVQASDGTNLVNIFVFHPNAALALTTTSWFDQFFEYLLDAAASGSGGGAAGQLLPGGATSFNVLTTMGGTAPTSSMDLEITPLI